MSQRYKKDSIWRNNGLPYLSFASYKLAQS